MNKLKLTVFVDVFGRVSPTEKFKDSCPPAEEYQNELLKTLFLEEYCYGDLYTDYSPGFYVAEFDIFDDYSYQTDECTEYLQIKQITELK